MDEKPLEWVGSALNDVRALAEHRVLYIAKFEEAVYVLHAFEKKAQKALKRDINVARTRLATVSTLRGVAAKVQKEES